jgi:hypothetical protein
MSIRTIFYVLVVFQLVCFSTVFAQTPTVAKKEIKSFAFVPATRPIKFSLGASSRDLATQSNGVVLSDEDATALRLTQRDVFEDAMIGLNIDLDAQLNSALESELKLLGYELKPIKNLKRRLLQPDQVDYKRISFESDALLQVSFYDIGAYRPKGTATYYND